MKYYTRQEIVELYQKLTKDEKIEILYSALSFMQQYNGRTTFFCIALAMGFNNYEGENNTYYKVD